MPSTLLGDRKVGRPMCEDRAYAEEMGVSLRVIRRFGGAKKLKDLSPVIQRLLLKKSALKGRSWGLEALGMKVNKPHSVGEKFEAHLHELMVQRGLQRPD